MPTLLIVPAWSDQAGQCRIVMHPHDPPRPLDHYRRHDGEWREVGLMNSRGELVCLDAPPAIYDEIKADEPLAAGTTYRY